MAAADPSPIADVFVPVTAAVIGLLGGAAVGALINALSQHRSWRRDARLKAYTEMVDAYDHAERCAVTCVDTLMRFLGNEDEEKVRARLEDAWGSYKEATRQLANRRAAIDIVGSDEARETADTLVSDIERVNVLYFYRLRPARKGVAKQYQSWIDDQRSRDEGRALLVDAIRADLKIHKLRTRVWRRSALTWMRVSRRLTRSRS